MRKQHIRSFFSCLLILCLLLSMAGCGKTKDTGITTVALSEVAHSVFYAPMYAAIENGYFKEEGIDLQLTTGFGADKTMAAVISGDADIGFMGTESSIYAYAEGAKDSVQNFAQLTQRAGNFLVAREPSNNFSYQDLIGKDVLGGRSGGTPQMVFEYILKKNHIAPTDININQNIDFGSTAAAFAGGQGDYTVEFEPAATALEASGDGYVIASLGVDSGYVPYTAFSAKKSYIKEHSDTVQAFTNALQKGLEYTAEHSAEEIAQVIAPQFPDTDLETLTTIVARYRGQDTWKADLILSESSYNLVLDILREADVLSEDAPYEELVTTKFAKSAAK